MSDIHAMLRAWATWGQGTQAGYPRSSWYCRSYQTLEWEESHGEGLLSEEEFEAIEQAVRALDDEQRRVLIAWYLWSDPLPERVKRLQLSWSRAMRVLHAAHAQVAKSLAL